MRILHIENLAGVPAILANAQRASGHKAVVMETHRNPFNFPHDIELYYRGNGLLHDINTMKKVSKTCIDFDIVHVHGGLNRKRLDILSMHLIHRKPLVVHYHGSETRMGYGMAYISQASEKIVSRPDLLKWHKEADFIPNPIEIVTECKFNPETVPIVCHITHNRGFKGTDLIIEGMKELAQEGLNFKFELVENQPHETALKKIEESHILIDQVIPTTLDLPSVIGMVSLEAMVRGRAVVSTFDQEYRSYYPECPVQAIDFGKSNLKEEIRYLIRDMDRTMKLGALGRKYVSEQHSPKIICDKVMKVYDRALR
jgi:glycosyltransferase involved in cell wall biosynthesis